MFIQPTWIYPVGKWMDATDCFDLPANCGSETVTVTNSRSEEPDFVEESERMEDLPHRNHEGRSDSDEPPEPPPR